MKTREKVRIDYRVFGSTGEKVVKMGETEVEDYVYEELSLVQELEYALDIHKVEDLGSEEDLNVGLLEVEELGRKFRGVHTKLQLEMKEKYQAAYPKKDKLLEDLSKYLKSVRKKRAELQKTFKHDKLKSNFSLLEKKMSLLRGSYALDSMTPEEMNDFIERGGRLLEDYYEVFSDLKGVVSEDECNDVITPQFDKNSQDLNEDIKNVRVLRSKVPVDVPVVPVTPTNKSWETIRADNLSEEIDLRGCALSKKFDQDFEILGDYQILELSQNQNLDLEFNRILEKITELSSLVASIGDQTLHSETFAWRQKLSEKRDEYSKNLQSVVVSRDITPDKMKNACTLQIDIPKFSGYESSIDFFSFKTKFQKLVEPRVQKPYWVDYLKLNYLGGLALTLVDKEVDYLKIWSRLEEAYGNTRLLLHNKLGELNKIGGLWKIKGDNKTAQAIAGLINIMKELSILAVEHDLEGQLYEGGGLEKVLSLIGDGLHRKFRSQNMSKTVLGKKDEWKLLMDFLTTELNLRERLVLDRKTSQLMGVIGKPEDKNQGQSERGNKNNDSKPTHVASPTTSDLCHVCDKPLHTVVTTAKGNKIIPYYVCEEFVKMTPTERLKRLQAKGLCTGCLFPGAKSGPPHRCIYLNFCCHHPSHGSAKVHVLLCEQHKNDDKNTKKLEKFKEKFVKNCPVSLPEFTKLLSCVSNFSATAASISAEKLGDFECEPPIHDSAIFLFQTIQFGGITMNLFFDNGCGDMVIRKAAVEKLVGLKMASQVVPGPLLITGVGGKRSVSEDGVYAVCLPLHNGRYAKFTGLCLPEVTTEFPKYPLKEVQNDIAKGCSDKKLVKTFPKLPESVGGEVDMLIGIKNIKWFPKLVFELDTGLGLYNSPFVSPCGSRGVVGGPHPKFTEIENNFKGFVNGAVYFTETVGQLMSQWSISNDIPLLGVKDDYDRGMIDGLEHTCCMRYSSGMDETYGASDDYCGLNDSCDVLNHECVNDEHRSAVMAAKRAPRCLKLFEEIEKSGTEISYRCVDCRSCVKCKNDGRIDAISIQDEFEQKLIENSVVVNADEGYTEASLPFIVDNPDIRLAPNEEEAMKVFRSQVRKLATLPDDKATVIESERKMQDMGYVDYLSNLTSEEQGMIMGNVVRYFIPWRAVFNENSVTTPCRLVFDASMGSKGGCSLNSLLAKGSNNMNNLAEIHIRWRTHRHAFHTDVTKMYNTVRLKKSHWRYQLYLWSDNLDPSLKPVWKVIKTLIYGVRSSGNQAECALRRTAELSEDQFPEAADAVKSDTYVDDCMSGTTDRDKTFRVTDDLIEALVKGGFNLKGFTMSGEDPPGNLSLDKLFVLVGGIKWFSNGDFIGLNIKELNFNKKNRGKKAKDGAGIPDNLLFTDCASKVAEIFDPCGLVAPITGGMKTDISFLHERKLGWQERIPGELMEIWSENFNVIQELGQLKFNRAVIPENAVNLDVETINVADAGDNLICAAVYARYKLKSGKYSCQLIFARTKVVHDLTTPRAELEAAVLNASTGHVVRKSLAKWHKKCINLTDSQVVLHWLNCTKLALKKWVRNRVVEILRLTMLIDWRYVRSEDNVTDIGTRKGAKISDVGPDSPWARGFRWMSDDESEFPLKTVDDIILSNKDSSLADREKTLPSSFDCLTTKCVPSEVGERYKFSRYLIDPCRFRFPVVVRILTFVFKFLENLNEKCKGTRTFHFLKKYEFNMFSSGSYEVAPLNDKAAVIRLSEELLAAAMAYFFRKATLEVKHFIASKHYDRETVLKDDILYHSGRILSTQAIDGKLGLADVCTDLAACTFCVPVTDSHSPIAYAIVNETHWYHPDVSHGGIESVLRCAQTIAHIIWGRSLVKLVKKGCARCRFLHARAVRAAMGPVGERNLKIAPPFYFTQVDIAGYFNAYSPINKRATIKIWLTIFCCTVTGTVDIRVMENYTADAFVMSFVRFSSRFGYPKLVMPDEGSQLKNGCENMIISFSDIRHQLNVKYGVDFETCPVNAHYVHGKVERKIREIRKSLKQTVSGRRLSVLCWETLGCQIANSINNMPIGLGNKCELLESLDILTPNRLILGRNNNRAPTAPLELSNDFRRIIEGNNDIFSVWFKEWLIGYVPSLVQKPKWFDSDRNISVGDVVLFLKAEKEFERQYQYGIVSTVVTGRDGIIRVVEIEYQNHAEKVRRTTKRCVRDIIVIHPVEELGLSKELDDLAKEA